MLLTQATGNLRVRRRPRVNVFELVSRSRGPAEPYIVIWERLPDVSWSLADRSSDVMQPLNPVCQNITRRAVAKRPNR